MAAQSGAVKQSFFTPQEVSEFLRVSVYTVRRWIRQGDLPADKVGREWRINALTIDEWFDEQEVMPANR